MHNATVAKTNTKNRGRKAKKEMKTNKEVKSRIGKKKL